MTQPAPRTIAPRRTRHSTLMSLGEPLKHNALLVEDALEPCLEGRVAPPLLDVLSDGGSDRLRSGHAVNPRDRVEFGGLLGILADGRGAGVCHRVPRW